MNDQLLMENVLLLLKSNTEVYVHGTLESTNKKVHDALHFGLEETLKLQHNLYQKMTEFGWYQIKNIEVKMIKDTLKKLEEKNKKAFINTFLFFFILQ